jgi:hypothetical protein
VAPRISQPAKVLTVELGNRASGPQGFVAWDKRIAFGLDSRNTNNVSHLRIRLIGSKNASENLRSQT